MAKMMLRGVNFSCSLIVLALVATTFMVFNATRALPARNGLPAWSANSKPWPQILLLTIASISLVFALGIFYAYWRGGHKRAEKAAVYYTVFAVFFFAFSIIMWAVGAAILNSSRNNGNGQDIWGWSCKDNKRRELFKDEVGYALVCRMQEWALVCCIIEIVVETITIAIYAIVFYRFWSKRKLRKSMDIRDKARSDLYLAQLRTQSAPNTPGFAQSMRSPTFPTKGGDEYSSAENGENYSNTKFATASPASSNGSSSFKLQAPPIKVHNATPRAPQDGFDSAPTPTGSPPPKERKNEHVAAAPGEQTYDAVPIPGAYASPLTSSALQAQQGSMAAQMQRGEGAGH
jgi:cbb3-type cytochrome oxidase subunit 3